METLLEKPTVSEIASRDENAHWQSLEGGETIKSKGFHPKCSAGGLSSHLLLTLLIDGNCPDVKQEWATRVPLIHHGMVVSFWNEIAAFIAVTSFCGTLGHGHCILLVVNPLTYRDRSVFPSRDKFIAVEI
jgi:hypothetical protein